MADSELRIVFLDEGGAQAPPPPAPQIPQASPPDEVGQASQSGQAATSRPAPVAPLPVDIQPLKPIPVEVKAAGPPAGASSATLSAAEAEELFQKYGVRPAQVGLRAEDGQGPDAPAPVASPPPAPVAGPPATEPEDADLEARLKHQDEMRETLESDESDEPEKPKRRRRRDTAGPEAEPKAPPLPGEVPPPPPKAPKEEKDKPSIFDKVGIQTATAVGSQVGGALAGTPGATAGGAMAAEGLAALGPLAAAAGPAAIALGAVAVGAVAVVAGTKAMVDALTAGAESIRDLSPDVALANAENEIRQTFAMLRRAEQVGPQLALFQNDKGRFEEALTDAVTKILDLLTDIYEDNREIVEMLILIARIVGEMMPFVKEQLEPIIALAKGDIATAIKEGRDVLPAQLKAMQKILEILMGATEPKEVDFDPFEFLGDLRRMAGLPGGDPAGGKGRVPHKPGKPTRNGHPGRPPGLPPGTGV